jgi:hypothetical protein
MSVLCYLIFSNPLSLAPFVFVLLISYFNYFCICCGHPSGKCNIKESSEKTKFECSASEAKSKDSHLTSLPIRISCSVYITSLCTQTKRASSCFLVIVNFDLLVLLNIFVLLLRLAVRFSLIFSYHFSSFFANIFLNLETFNNPMEPNILDLHKMSCWQFSNFMLPPSS